MVLANFWNATLQEAWESVFNGDTKIEDLLTNFDTNLECLQYVLAIFSGIHCQHYVQYIMHAIAFLQEYVSEADVS